MNNEMLYFFTDEMIESNPNKFNKCDCSDEDCNIILMDIEKEKESVIINVDFKNKKVISFDYE